MMKDINSGSLFKIRHAEVSDEELILRWANDPDTRQNAFSTEFISSENHHKWFHSRIGDHDNFRIYILENESGIPVGQARFERCDTGWEIDYSVAPEYRNRGIGRILLEKTLSKLRSEFPGEWVFGKVKMTNIPSQRVFESLKFEEKMCNDGIFLFQLQL